MRRLAPEILRKRLMIEGFFSRADLTRDFFELTDFLVRVFDAVELRRFPMPDGTGMHAEVRLDDTVIMLGDGGGEWPAIPANVPGGVRDGGGTTWWIATKVE